jgi:predicted dithiol-disulfide oxidoreductase (DUF899 family)
MSTNVAVIMEKWREMEKAVLEQENSFRHIHGVDEARKKLFTEIQVTRNYNIKF